MKIDINMKQKNFQTMLDHFVKYLFSKMLPDILSPLYQCSILSRVIYSIHTGSSIAGDSPVIVGGDVTFHSE